MSELEEFYKKNPNISEDDFDLGHQFEADGSWAVIDYVKAEYAIKEFRSTFGDDVITIDDFKTVLTETDPYLSEGEIDELSHKFGAVMATDISSIRDNHEQVTPEWDSVEGDDYALAEVMVGLDTQLSSGSLGKAETQYANRSLQANFELHGNDMLEAITQGEGILIAGSELKNTIEHGSDADIKDWQEKLNKEQALRDQFLSLHDRLSEIDMASVQDNVVVDEVPKQVLAEIKAGVADQFDGPPDEFTTFEPIIVNLADHDLNAEGRDAIKFRDAIVSLNKDLATGELESVTAQRSQVVIDESIRNHGDVLLAASEQYPDLIASQIEAEAGHIFVDVSTDPDFVAAEAKHGEFMGLLLEYDQERLLTAQQTQAITQATPQEVDQHLNETQSFGETTPQEVGQAIAEFTRGGFQHIDDVSEDTIFSKVASLEQENAELQRGDNFESVQKNTTAVEQLLVIAALEGSEEPRAVNALNSVNYDMNLLAETPVPTQSYWSVEDQDDIHVGSDRDRHLQSILDAVTEKRELETVLADRYNEALEEPNQDLQSKEIAKLTLDLDELRQEQRMDDYWEKRQAVEHDYGLEQ